jgi:3,4-dihydroxy-2-butanone 4-phosphate synthase
LYAAQTEKTRKPRETYWLFFEGPMHCSEGFLPLHRFEQRMAVKICSENGNYPESQPGIIVLSSVSTAVHASSIKNKQMAHDLRFKRHENNKNSGPFVSIETAIRELRAGRMIVVVDDPDRENEGDLTIAAEMITPEAINFMATHGRGLICLPMTGDRLDQLELGLMVPESAALGSTAFTVSIDVKRADVTTGISAYDRACTIRAAIDVRTRPSDLTRPGHVFPLRARPGGVLERRGQTEAAVDLAKLAGLYPAGVICEVVNEDGTMARVPDLSRFCKKHNLGMVSVADLARYRLDSDFAEAATLAASALPVRRAG